MNKKRTRKFLTLTGIAKDWPDGTTTRHAAGEVVELTDEWNIQALLDVGAIKPEGQDDGDGQDQPQTL